jgi:sulfane dehydrogenase subunit SoxC
MLAESGGHDMLARQKRSLRRCPNDRESSREDFMKRKNPNATSVSEVAGNGLLDRRALLGRGMFFAGVAAAGVGTANSAGAEALQVDPWSMEPGAPIPPYGVPAKYENKVVRTLTNPNNEARTSNGRTPHHLLDGTITPNGLHFVVARSGFPDIDPAKHRLVIHGLVKQPLVFDLEALARYPKVTRIQFVECGGNSAPLFNKDPVEANVQAIHGLLSCSEWTGVRLSTLLEETGIDPKAKWLLAEGADGPSMNRSIPLAKALDDTMVALYQNGERINPAQGYPMRLLVPGYEGNMNVKWLHRIKLVEEPVMAINETMQYTYRVAGPKIWQFFFPMEVKSFVTNPSPGLTLKGPGFYEISGLAYSGNGRIAKVMVSADGGKSWGEAALDGPVLSKALTRFRMPWRWDGQPVVLQSRAWDEAGNVQPTRSELFKERGEPKVNLPVTAFPMGHMNVITSWGIDGKGEAKHVYA